jgi:hypothetical protein
VTLYWLQPVVQPASRKRFYWLFPLFIIENVFGYQKVLRVPRLKVVLPR